MRANSKVKNLAMSVIAAVGVLATSASYAATIPGSIFTFTPAVANNVFEVKSKGWSDPLFGDMGWTHSSDWGVFHAEKGQVVTITMKSTNLGIHPGSTVWFRSALDTAPDNYVVDHFYAQDGSAVKRGATDETTGAALGNIIMKHVVHGYDADNITTGDAMLNGKKDTKPGVLVHRFKAPYSGEYIFVVGGIDPDLGIDNALIYKVKVNVKLGAVPTP
jgi:hypothetical protein